MPANGDKKDGRNRKMLREDVYRTEWTAEEQRKLEQLMNTYTPAKVSGVQRYVLIADKLEGKSIRDVAMRIRWMKEREMAKARKDEAGGGTKKARTPRPRDPDTPSIFATGHMQPGMAGPGGMMGGMGQPHPQQMMMGGHPMAGGGGGVHGNMHRALMLEDHGRETVGSLDGPPQQLLEQNVGLIHSVRQNMSGCRIQENTELLSAFHSNLVTLLSSLPKQMSRMAQMPPLPVKLNQELAMNVLGKSGEGPPMG